VHLADADESTHLTRRVAELAPEREALLERLERRRVVAGGGEQDPP